MKIGFFCNTYLPNMYGSTTSVVNFRSGLEKLGHEVFIFTPNHKGYEYNDRQVVLYPSIMYGYKVKYPLPIAWYPPIHKKAKEIGLDIVHCQQPFSIGQDGLRIANESKIPAIFTHHARYEDYSHYILPFLSQRLIKWYIRKTVTKFANSCDKIIVPSQSIDEYVKERKITTPTEIVSTGIEWERFQRGNREKIRNHWKINSEEKLILYLGRIDLEKNGMFMAESVFSLMKKRDKTKFMLVGEGSLVPKIIELSKKEGLQERVIVTGLVQQSEVQDYYAAADVFVHASQTETQGMTIIEALAAGLAVVAVEGTGVNDQMKGKDVGVLTPLDQKTFSNAIAKFLDDQKARLEFGQRAREFAKSMDFFSQAKRMEKIYIDELEKK